MCGVRLSERPTKLRATEGKDNGSIYQFNQEGRQKGEEDFKIVWRPWLKAMVISLNKFNQ